MKVGFRIRQSLITLNRISWIYTAFKFQHHFFILFVKGLEVLPLVLGGVTIIFLIDNFDEYVLINV